MTGRTVDIGSFIDRAALRGLLLRAPILCALVMLMEGVDNYGGFVGPFLSKDYHIPPEALGIIHTGTVVASLIGAVCLGPLSDWIGRRRVLIISSFMLGACAALTPLASNIYALFLVRFLIGMGFGTSLPSALTLTAEYAPARSRAFIITIMTGCIALGVVVAGLASALIIPKFGWHLLMYLTGGVSLVSTGLLALALPESVRFLLLRRPDSPETLRLIAILKHEQGTAPDIELVAEELQPVRRPARALVQDSRGPLTLTLWFAMSATYFGVFLLSFWLPTILMADGTSVQNAGFLTSAGKIASMIGAVMVGWSMDRASAWRVLPVAYVCAAVSIVVLGMSVSCVAWATVLILVSYLLLDGSFAGIQALIATSYPVSMRATATGWISGLARLIGGGAGTMAGGFVVGAHLSVIEIALLLATPMLLGGGVLMLGSRLRSGEQQPSMVGATE
jgi:AAHS family 4-hydroxybenzoate transporter-like MFS transporter